MIDIHSHVLFDVDDGPTSLDESMQMCKIAADDGITNIIATPHMLNGVYINTPNDILNNISTLQAELNKQNIDITIHPGADTYLTHDILNHFESGNLLTLNNSNYLLLEFPNNNIPPFADDIIFQLQLRGITIILTHPERYPYLINSSYIETLHEKNVLFQVTAASIMGKFGKQAEDFSLKLIKKGFVSFIASDAHGIRDRKPILSKSYAKVQNLFGEGTAKRIYYDNPQKIIF